MEMNKPKIGIVGSGVMGREIAAFLTENKYPVLMKARKEADIEAFNIATQKTFTKLFRRKKISEAERDYLMAQTKGTTVFDSRFKDLDIIIETIVENADIKTSLYRRLEEICSEKAIICSNTSSLSITSLSNGLKNKERFLGLHFFQPFRAFKFIEVVAGEQTSESTLNTARELVNSLNKIPFAVKDSPCFFFNRVQLTNMLEVFLALESGWHDIETLNQEYKDSQFYLAIMNSADKLGIDVLEDSILNCNRKWEDRFPAPDITELMRAKGRYGEKSGKGFFDYTVKPPAIDTEMQSIMEQYKAKRSEREYGFSVTVGIHRIMNEGIFCLEDQIADIQDAEVVMSSVPPFAFMKGFYRAMDEMGLDVLYNNLVRLEKEFGTRYRPAPLLKEKVDKRELGVKTGKGFFEY